MLIKTLYQKSSSVEGRILEWSIHYYFISAKKKINYDDVDDILKHAEEPDDEKKSVNYIPVLITYSGIVEGRMKKSPIVIQKFVKKYGNRFTYAEELAKQKISKQLKKKYFEKLNKAKESITIRPMLLAFYNKLKKRKKQIDLREYYIQPKLNGVRCFGHYDSAVGEFVFTSRTENVLVGFETISRELKTVDELLSDNIYVDGELYNGNLPVQKINSIIQREKDLTENDMKEKNSLKLYVFDVADTERLDWQYKDRRLFLNKLFSDHKMKHVKQVSTIKPVGDEKELDEIHKKIVDLGYEGIVLRKKTAPYLFNKRAVDEIIKKKFRITKEFEIVDFDSAQKGAQKGSIIWICITPEGDRFYVVPKGATLEEKKQAYIDVKKNPGKFIGKMLEVGFDEYTSDGIPSHATSRLRP